MLSPSPAFPAPKRRVNPEYYEPAVQNGLQAAFLDVVTTHPVRTLPGVTAVLTELRKCGVRLAMVSASPRPVGEEVLRQLGPESFDAVFADGDTVRTKPVPDPYLAAAALLGVSPEGCLALEDSPPGVASAEAAGMAVLVVGSAVPRLDLVGRTYADSLSMISLVAAFAGRESCSFLDILT